MHDALAIFPIGHATARLHAVVGEAGGDKALVEHRGGFLEPGVHVTVGPFGNRPAHGKLAFSRGGKVGRRPLDGLRFDAPAGDIAVTAGVGPARVEALQRIEREGERLKIQFDEVDGVLGRGFVHGSHRQNGLAHVAGFVGQDRRLRRAGRLCGGNVVGGKHRVDTVKGQGRRRIDAAHPGMGHRAGEELAEKHALGPEIFRVLGLSSYLAAYIRRHEIVTQERIRHDPFLPFGRPCGARIAYARLTAIDYHRFHERSSEKVSARCGNYRSSMNWLTNGSARILRSPTGPRTTIRVKAYSGCQTVTV